VFQDYALFPHMNVRDNVGYGLMVKGVATAERARRVTEALALVALSEYGERRPSQLSGGQRQRVALARALINRPRVLLLDEPLGALDLKLREQMQGELKSLQRKLGITFIYVTHDQGEALSMSDRVAVFNHGRIEQVDTPRNLYMRPATMFVADFVGTSNVLAGTAAERISGSTRPFSIRPEQIRLVATAVDDPASVCVSGQVRDVQYHGASNRIGIALADGTGLVASIGNDEAGEKPVPAIGDPVHAVWARAAMVMLETAGQ
jgi:putative spermidine/putrescine transport system ATP-binding protein